MKILVVSRFKTTIDTMNKLYTIYAYFLNFHLGKLCDVTHAYYKTGILNKMTPNQYDAIIMLFNARGVPNEYKELAKTKSRVVCCISENSNRKVIEQILFYMKGRPRRGCIPITWMCDSTICAPAQVKNEINILIDHNWPGYVIQGTDMTDYITHQVKQFARDYKGNKKIIIKRLYHGGTMCVTIDPYEKDLPVVHNIKVRTAYKDICKTYAVTDIFFVTHKESLGMTVLETAMCGALVVVPKNFIKGHLIKCVKHVDFTDIVPWDTLTSIISSDTNIAECREMAMKYSWERAAKVIYMSISLYRKYKHHNCVLTPKLQKIIYAH